MERSSNGEEVESLSATINFHGSKLEMNRAKISHLRDSSIQEKFTVNKLKEADNSAWQEEELELFHTKKAEKDLIFRNSTDESEDFECAELTQQLDCLKQEISKLKIGVSSALESKAQAEKDIEIYNQKESLSLKKVEELRKEIEEANEEHVLVELARIEAEKEWREIESQRAAEAKEHSKKMEENKKRISELRREISGAEELEEKLAATNADVIVLQNEMKLVKAMEENFSMEILKNVENELRKARKELESIKEESFQLMTSMDLVRVELVRISEEKNSVKKLEKSADLTMERLNSKLLKGRSKLESETSAEERSRGIVSNLSTALQQLRSEVETAEEEKKKARKETSDIKEEIEMTEMEIKCTQKKLLDSMPELERVKASEAAALVKLKSMVEKMVKSRAMDSQNSSMIRISKWEYEYLNKKAGLAMDVAEKKVAAINAWIGTLRAQEKEILLKSELIEKEIEAMRVSEEEEEEVCKGEKRMAGMSSPRKLISENPIRRSRRWSHTRRVSAMQGMKSAARSPSFTIKKRKREIPALAALLRRRNGRMKQNDEVDFDSYASSLLAHENDHSQR